LAGVDILTRTCTHETRTRKPAEPANPCPTLLVDIRIVHQFDIPTGNNKKDGEVEKELQDLAEGLNIEEAMTQREQEVSDEDKDDEEIEGWADKRRTLSEANRKKHDACTRPVRMLLVKVSHYPDILCQDSPASVANFRLQ
jgi:hypothetical protein